MHVCLLGHDVPRVPLNLDGLVDLRQYLASGWMLGGEDVKHGLQVLWVCNGGHPGERVYSTWTFLAAFKLRKGGQD